MNEVSDSELKSVIADFLEMGHVENIVSMFKKEPLYYGWTGEILQDERFNVRLGLTILFEELRSQGEDRIEQALPSLKTLLDHESSLIRGEAVSILGIIGTDEAIRLVRSKTDDTSPQVREMAAMALEEWQENNEKSTK